MVCSDQSLRMPFRRSVADIVGAVAAAFASGAACAGGAPVNTGNARKPNVTAIASRFISDHPFPSGETPDETTLVISALDAPGGGPRTSAFLRSKRDRSDMNQRGITWRNHSRIDDVAFAFRR